MYIKKSFQAYQTDFSSAPKTIITVHKTVPQDEIIYPARRIILSYGIDKSVLRDGSFRLARRIYLHNTSVHICRRPSNISKPQTRFHPLSRINRRVEGEGKYHQTENGESLCLKETK
jgi:hypothetical protein